MIYAFTGENSIEDQTYEEHVQEMLKCWKILRDKYQKSLQRILRLSVEEVDTLVKAIIILHDSGKCTEFYQDAIKQNKPIMRYRHEVVSAYLAYEVLKNRIDEPFLSVASATILLHHEPILMGCISTQREKGITLTDIRGRIEYPYGAETSDTIRNKTKKLHIEFNELLRSLLNENRIVAEYDDIDEIDVNSLIETLGKSITITSIVGDSFWRQKMRSMVSSLLYVNLVCDYYGSRKRGGESRFAREIEWEWGDF